MRTPNRRNLQAMSILYVVQSAWPAVGRWCATGNQSRGEHISTWQAAGSVHFGVKSCSRRQKRIGHCARQHADSSWSDAPGWRSARSVEPKELGGYRQAGCPTHPAAVRSWTRHRFDALLRWVSLYALAVLVYSGGGLRSFQVAAASDAGKLQSAAQTESGASANGQQGNHDEHPQAEDQDQRDASAPKMEWIEIADDGRHFQFANSQQRFVAWGFNYDHEGDGRLLEDYWHTEWEVVESALQEMRSLGANVVRIHLQFGKFMETPDRPNVKNLQQLARLVRTAEQVGLYLDITGLGCYHKDDVPPWYDRLDEQQRWQAQAAFWQAIAKQCAESPAVFCYDLMNEPVVPGGDRPRTDWLGPAFAGKHFVQFISLDRRGRDRVQIARQWIQTLTAAIRQHDQRHLITVGLVPWSLDRPGLTSGFVPDKIADQLDFLAVHIYPETNKVDEAIQVLDGFAKAGKPVLIEEIFPLKCDIETLERFIDQSRGTAAGWIGFYWGSTPEELTPPSNIPEAITLQWLTFFQRKTSELFMQASR